MVKRITRVHASTLENLERRLPKLKRKVKRSPTSTTAREKFRATRRTIKQLNACIALNGDYLASIATPTPTPTPDPIDDTPCSISVSAIARPVAIIPPHLRTVELAVESSCSESPSLEIVAPPTFGELTTEKSTFSFSTDRKGWGADAFTIRACADDVRERRCSDPLVVSVRECDLTPTTTSVNAIEHRTNEFTLGVSSQCALDSFFEITSTPEHGTLSTSHDGTATYTVGFTEATRDSFSYHVCDRAGAGCGAQQEVTVTIGDAPAFDGNAESLASYRGDASPAELRHLLWKVGLAREDLLRDLSSSSPLATLLDDRLLPYRAISEDLAPTLQEVQQRGLEYGEPIESEEFIPGWSSDTFTERDGIPFPVAPIFKPSLQWNNPTNVHLAFERWLAISQRGYNMNNRRYTWGADRMTNYLLQQARYSSPLRASMLTFWLGHFGTNTLVVPGGRENWIGYYLKTLERESLGNFRSMLVGRTGDANGCAPLTPWNLTHGSILCDAASNSWLGNQNNLGQNQNLAREIMELYTMSPTDEVTGHANYTDVADVTAAARYLSGFKISRKTVGGRNVDVLAFDSTRHDTTPDSMFTEMGAIAPQLPLSNRTLQPGEFVRHILANHPGVARFIAGKLFSTFVYPDPPDHLVAELGARFKEMDYELAPFMRMILSSEAMFSTHARERRCVSSPLQVFSKLVNLGGLSLVAMKSAPNLQWYYQRWFDEPLRLAGESPMGYPTVFSYGYCGRDPGKDGSAEWLQPFLLVFRVTGFTEFLNGYYTEFQGYADLADRMRAIIAQVGGEEAGPEGVLGYFEEAFGVTLDPEERDVILEYLTHRLRSDGSRISVTWDVTNALLMREKLAGLLTIFAVHPSAGTH